MVGLDYWSDVDTMNDWYAQASYDAIAATVTGAPDTNTLVVAGADWVEW